MAIRSLYLKFNNIEYSTISSNFKEGPEEQSQQDASSYLSKIEQRLHFFTEAYDCLMKFASKSSKVQRELAEKFRLLDIDKKHKKQDVSKVREFEERQRKLEKNLEKVNKSKSVSVNRDVRALKIRSRKPTKVKFVKKVEPTEEELDY